MFQDHVTQIWIRFLGRKVTYETDPWIFGPTSILMYRDISLNRTIQNNADYLFSPSNGIIDSISSFGFTEKELKRIHPIILDFYTHTSQFNMDMSFHWSTLFKPLAYTVKFLFSRRLQQMNIPIISSNQVLKTHSFIVKIDEKKNEKSQNLWVRKFLNANEIIFSGIYSIASTKQKDHLIKVQFPLPNGNATIFLEKSVLQNGNLELASKGLHFGDSGFYFFLKKGESYYVKYVKSMHEKLSLTVKDTSTIKGIHEFFFYGRKFLTINYSLYKK